MEFQSCSLSQTLTVMSDGGGGASNDVRLLCDGDIQDTSYRTPARRRCWGGKWALCSSIENLDTGSLGTAAVCVFSPPLVRCLQCIKGAEEKGKQTQEILTSKRALQ
ncbi:unnamed protein product [Boreogadus saida]